MNYDDFLDSLNNNLPPEGLNNYLRALWFDQKGDWNKAHEIVQNIADEKAARIHAYLHRAEGDEHNANYWYARGGQEFNSHSLNKEWEHLVKEHLKK
jgi:hypothetical protein